MYDEGAFFGRMTKNMYQKKCMTKVHFSDACDRN
jgi:hypothetical protein